jgi:hypothetical protein
MFLAVLISRMIEWDRLVKEIDSAHPLIFKNLPNIHKRQRISRKSINQLKKMEELIIMKMIQVSIEKLESNFFL